MIDLTKLKTAEQKHSESQAQAKADRIAELKVLLANSDYKVLPDYDKNSEDIKAQRQAWREEVRTLEEQLA
jgi:hypothetical protein